MLGYHIRGVEIIFPKVVGDDEIEKVIDGLGFGMGLSEFTRSYEFKELKKSYFPPQGKKLFRDRSIDIEFIKSEYGDNKTVSVYVRSYEKEKTGELTAESLLQTVVTNLQEGFGADIKSIRRLHLNELPLMKWYVYGLMFMARFLYKIIIIVVIIAVLPLFLMLLTLLGRLLQS